MQILQFLPDKPPELIGVEGAPQGDGFYWIDVERSETDWHEHAHRWLGRRLHERHIADTLNDAHPPYYDGTDDYDMLIARTLCPDCPADRPTTKPIAFVLTRNILISVRPSGDPVFHKVHQRLLGLQKKSPNTTTSLMYQLLDRVVENLLNRRDVTAEIIGKWQERLLNPKDHFGDWQPLMRLRGHLRRLESITDAQLDALDQWRSETTLDFDQSLAVRYNDLSEHLRRVLAHSVVTQHDIDSLVQIYFSATTQKTNQILQLLAIVSCIFLPLHLIAGLFGMNFQSMPFLLSPSAPWVLLMIMIALAAGLLALFRKKRWL